jgi:hypothetical protein
VSERITEAELRRIENAPQDALANVPPLVREVRRLRGLVASFDCGVYAHEADADTGLRAEARAIREERGERLCTCVPSHGDFDGTCRNCRETRG